MYYKLKNRDAPILDSATMQCQAFSLGQDTVAPLQSPSTVYCRICCRKERPGITCLLVKVLLRTWLGKRSSNPLKAKDRQRRKFQTETLVEA